MNERDRPCAWLALAMAAGIGVLTGCAQPAAPQPDPVSVAQCQADPVRGLEGRAFSAQLQSDAQRLSGARVVRVIRPGQAVTMDFSVHRLNIELDAADRVQRLRCG